MKDVGDDEILKDGFPLAADGNEGLGEGGAPDRVGVSTKPDRLRRLMIDHMPDGSPSTLDVSDADDLFGFGIETY